MDGTRFDMLARILSATRSRRETVKAVAVAGSGFGLARFAPEDAVAKKKRKKRCKRLLQTCNPEGKRKCCKSLQCGDQGDAGFQCCKELGADCETSEECCKPSGQLTTCNAEGKCAIFQVPVP